MPNRVLAQKALKLKKQNQALSFGSHKPKSRNPHKLAKFSTKNERPYAFSVKPIVPSYDDAMVTRYDGKGRPVK